MCHSTLLPALLQNCWNHTHTYKDSVIFRKRGKSKLTFSIEIQKYIPRRVWRKPLWISKFGACPRFLRQTKLHCHKFTFSLFRTNQNPQSKDGAAPGGSGQAYLGSNEEPLIPLLGFHSLQATKSVMETSNQSATPVLISHKWSPVWVNRICSDPRFHGGLRNRAMHNLGVRSLSKVKFLQNMIKLRFFFCQVYDRFSANAIGTRSQQKLKHLKKKSIETNLIDLGDAKSMIDSLSHRGKIPLGVYIRFCFKN